MKLLIIISLFFVHILNAKTIVVGPKSPITSIKDALVLATAFDSIVVQPSVYQEGNIVIDKPITLIGKGFPVLDGQMKFEVISIKANHVSISGFKVINSGISALNDLCAIKIYDSEHVKIENNILKNNFFGIYTQHSKKCLIKNNFIYAYATEEQKIGNGIHCWKSDSLQIIANKVKGHRDGIYFEFVTHSIIWRNISTKNVRYGLHFMFSNNDSYVSNVFEGNGAGVAVMFYKFVNMYNNTFRNNWGDAAYGILLKEISDGEIIGNKFYRNTAALYFEGANRLAIKKNSITSNGWGCKIQASCMDNALSENNFIGNSFDISTNGFLVLNSFNQNYWDKYEGYDLNKDKLGDVPYHPLSLFSGIIEKNPTAMLLYRSFMVTLIERTEKLIPSLTPDNFVDNNPSMKPYKL